MTDDLIARAKAALKALDAQVYGGSAEQGALRRIGQESKFIRKARTLLPELLAEVERQCAGREFERGMLVAGAAEIQELGFKVEQLQAEQGEDRDEIHTLRRHLADEEAEVERLRGALDRLKVEWLENYEYEGGDGGGPTGYVFKACADGLRAVLLVPRQEGQ